MSVYLPPRPKMDVGNSTWIRPGHRLAADGQVLGAPRLGVPGLPHDGGGLGGRRLHGSRVVGRRATTFSPLGHDLEHLLEHVRPVDDVHRDLTDHAVELTALVGRDHHVRHLAGGQPRDHHAGAAALVELELLQPVGAPPLLGLARHSGLAGA
jgi:hypothetical protein